MYFLQEVFGMKNGFDFRSLVRIRQEDKLFSLLRRDKYLELFIAFLYDAFDKNENKELQEEVFIGLFNSFCSNHAEMFLEEGLEPPSAENALRLMMSDSYGLVTRRIVWDSKGEEADYCLVLTELYVDAVRLLEDRGQYTSIGSHLEMRDTITAVCDAADRISGDVEKQKETLRTKIASLQKELEELEVTGKPKPVSTEEVREQVYYIKRCVNNITATLSRGTSYFKEECSSYWNGITKDLSTSSEKKETGGTVALQVLSGLNSFLKSNAVRSYESALELLVNPEEQQTLNDSFERISNNPEVRKVMWEDDIDIKKVLRRIARDSADCYHIIHKELARLNAYMRSGEVERNRLLYRKADEILLFWKENGNKVPIRRYLFQIPGTRPRIISPARFAWKMPKAKLKLIQDNTALSLIRKPIRDKNSFAGYRDIRLAGIPEKFRRLLDKHNGRFSLSNYVQEEGTSFGIFEFLSVRFIMVRYMGKDMVQSCLQKPKQNFKVVDLVPRDGTSKVKEIVISAHEYNFDEEAYAKWKKDKFKM